MFMYAMNYDNTAADFNLAGMNAVKHIQLQIREFEAPVPLFSAIVIVPDTRCRNEGNY